MDSFSWIFDPTSPWLFSQVFIWLILKIMFLVAFGIYIVFAFVIVRQISIMTRTLKTGFEGLFTLLGLAHFFFAIAIWIFAFITLPL